MAYPRLNVTQALVLVRQGTKALRGDSEPVREHGELTSARGDDLAVHPDVIAEVHILLPRGQRVGADAVQGDHDLDVAGPIANCGEAEFSASSRQHYPPRNADLLPGGGVRFPGRIACAQLTD